MQQHGDEGCNPKFVCFETFLTDVRKCIYVLGGWVDRGRSTKCTMAVQRLFQWGYLAPGPRFSSALMVLALFSLPAVLSPLCPPCERVYGLRQELGQRAEQFPNHAPPSFGILACCFYTILRRLALFVSSTMGASLPFRPSAASRGRSFV
jgi:hypothetical protein